MNRANLKVIFQDVDGCLNPVDGEDFGADPTWQVSASQMEMLEAIGQAVDHSPIEHFVINTGRFWSILESIVEHLKTPKLRYCIMEHACVVIDLKTRSMLDLKALANRHGMIELAQRYDNLREMSELIEWYEQKGQAALETVFQTPLPRLNKSGNLTFRIPEYLDGGDLLRAIETMAKKEFRPDTFEKFEFCRSDSFIDILPGIHKMDGITLMLAHLNLQPSQAIAVGDYLNDLAVFNHFDQVMCPANAHSKIRSITEAKGKHGVVSNAPFGQALLEFLETIPPAGG